MWLVIRSLAASVATACLLCPLAVAGQPTDWLNWRGPNAQGSILQGNFPTQFNADSYTWRAELPGKGCSTPIVVNQHIMVTAPMDGHDGLLCFDIHGNQQWHQRFGPEDPGKHRNGSGSNCSPVSDGAAVFAYFKSGTLAAVEMNGSLRWQQNIVDQYGKENMFWDYGSSPVLTERYVVLVRMHDGDSWIAAFDKADGRLVWKQERNYKTPVECDQCYTTPLVLQHAGQEALLTWGAEHITIHAAADGRLLWSCGNFNPEGHKLWPAIASPVVADGHVVIAYGRNDRGLPLLFGVSLSGNGNVTATNHAWSRNDVGTFVPTPLVGNQQIIVVGDQGEVECLSPSTGKTVWKQQLPKHRNKFYASPLLAGHRLYAPREDGVVFVGEIKDNAFRLLEQNNMGQSIIGSPVPLGNGLLLRGENHLFYVAEK
ncbi:MAG: PQQ-binding-like beta-propeller repeat protein [Pirellulaceae bacterium]|nr:PQQ-binding-like beta-propeller repeat protein [Pirellulaceae bacterium]